MAEVLMIAGKPETIFTARDFEYLVENTWVMKRQSISGNTQKKRMKK